MTHRFSFKPWQYPRAHVGLEREPTRSVHFVVPITAWKASAKGFGDLRELNGHWQTVLEIFAAVGPAVCSLRAPAKAKGGKKRKSSDDVPSLRPVGFSKRCCPPQKCVDDRLVLCQRHKLKFPPT
jgi:hypothetical protein